jgi:hypothetical protein
MSSDGGHLGWRFGTLKLVYPRHFFSGNATTGTFIIVKRFSVFGTQIWQLFLTGQTQYEYNVGKHKFCSRCEQARPSRQWPRHFFSGNATTGTFIIVKRFEIQVNYCARLSKLCCIWIVHFELWSNLVELKLKEPMKCLQMLLSSRKR